MTLTDQPQAKDGVLAGAERHPRNATGPVSVHDEATATKLGFRGATVSGTVLLDLFPPLMQHLGGQRWFERGNLSLFFENAILDAEPVHAYLDMPPAGATDFQVRAWIERADGMSVAKGTAAIGAPDATSALQSQTLPEWDPANIRILADFRPGEKTAVLEVVRTREDVDIWLQYCSDPLPLYKESSPWGGGILPPNELVRIMYSDLMDSIRARWGVATGFYGALEIQYVDGPAFVGQTYLTQATIRAIGQGGKTEFMWVDTDLKTKDGKLVAQKRMLLRFMKASSPLYAP